jgi:hypothetical protein
MSLHQYPFKPFVDLRATLKKGQNLEPTLIRAWVWRFFLGVRVGTVVHLYRDLFERMKSLDGIVGCSFF